MYRLRRTIRRLLAFTLYYSGMLWLYAAVRLRRKAVVLLYHRVLPGGTDSCSHPGIVVTPRTFDMHLAFLTRHFCPLSQAEFQQELAASSFRRRACLVTFDDGWHDNFEHAHPLLQKHSVPAIFFVATRYIGTNDTFWQERLTRLLSLAAAHDPIADSILTDIGMDKHSRTCAKGSRQTARKVVTSCKSQSQTAAFDLICRLESALDGIPGCRAHGADRFMSWDQVQWMSQIGLVTIGSHAHSHTRLTLLGYRSALDELKQSRRELEAHAIPTPAACAYPNGDVNDSVEAAAVDAAFTMGFGTKPGLVAHNSEAMHLRRVNIHEADARTRPEFLYRILGLP